jgi:hypothetical protein
MGQPEPFEVVRRDLPRAQNAEQHRCETPTGIRHKQVAGDPRAEAATDLGQLTHADRILGIGLHNRNKPGTGDYKCRLGSIAR